MVFVLIPNIISSVIRHRHEHIEDRSVEQVSRGNGVLTSYGSCGDGNGKPIAIAMAFLLLLSSSSIVAEDRKSWELLKSGEILNLIKQGFMERTQRRLSPGRVSPLQTTNQMQDTIAASTEKSMSPVHGQQWHHSSYSFFSAHDYRYKKHRPRIKSISSSSSFDLSFFVLRSFMFWILWDKKLKPANSTSTLFDMIVRDAEKTVRSNNKHPPPTAPYLLSSLTLIVQLRYLLIHFRY